MTQPSNFVNEAILLTPLAGKKRKRKTSVSSMLVCQQGPASEQQAAVAEAKLMRKPPLRHQQPSYERQTSSLGNKNPLNPVPSQYSMPSQKRQLSMLQQAGIKHHLSGVTQSSGQRSSSNAVTTPLQHKLKPNILFGCTPQQTSFHQEVYPMNK